MSRIAFIACFGLVLGCRGDDGSKGDDDDDDTTDTDVVGDDDDDAVGDDDDDAPTAVVGDLMVAPGSLSFGPLNPGESESQRVTLTNIGSGMVTVDDVALSDDAFEVVGPSLPWTIPTGSELSVDVRFELTDPVHEGNLVFISDQGTVTVGLSGYGHAPDLTLSPSRFDLQLAGGCTEVLDVVLGNEGEGVLEVTEFLNTENLTVVDAPAVPFQVEPGGAVPLSFQFTADGSGGTQTGELELITNDPEPAVVTVTAEVAGLGVFEDTLTVGVPVVDVMLMIDQSCSMEEDNTDDVELAFPGFVDTLDATADWRLSLFNDVDGCLFAGVANTTMPYVRDVLVNNAFNGISAFDLNYSLTESLLQLASVAADNAVPGGCNDGMLRPGAHLHVIVFSDEAEQSGFPGSHWVDELADHVAAPGELVISGVVDVNRTCGDGSGAGGYTQAINATGGLTYDICDPNWGTGFADAADLFPPTAVVEL